MKTLIAISILILILFFVALYKFSKTGIGEDDGFNLN